MNVPGKEKKRIFEGGLYPWMEKLFDALALNLLFLICCLPLVTIGASFAACYHCFAKVLRGERGQLFAEFQVSFRRNFVQGTLLWLVFAALLFLLLLNRNIAAGIGGPYISLFLICLYTFLGFLVLALALYAFPVLSRFEMKPVQILKLSIYMCFRYFPYTLVLLALVSIASLILYCLPLFIFCVPIFSLYPFSLVMEKLLIRHTPLPETGEREHKWYLSLALKGGSK